MRIGILHILFCLILIRANGQHKVDIPEFRNTNPEDKYPQNSILATYIDRFDILISLNNFSAWMPADPNIKVIAHHSSGWWKIEINTDPDFLSNTFCYSTNKINDTIGDILWNILNQNHLFDMKDGRQIQNTCITIDTVRYGKGKFRLAEIFHDNGIDGPEYKFEIITNKNYKQLYFYYPWDLENVCADPERKWIINCINAFEKYLGK